jgi:hypothetical protein
MARLLNNRPFVFAAAAVILVVTAGAAIAAPALLPQLVGRHTTGSQTLELPPTAVAESPGGPGATSVQLSSQDLTPSSHPSITASGFQAGEHLNVTIQDAQGNPYDLAPLVAGPDGSIRNASLSLPSQLGSGVYRLVAAGGTSHRTASTTFRMAVVPPTVVLDTYTSMPGQVVNFAGNGYIAGETVKVYLGSSTVPLASVKATALGTVTGHLQVPKLQPGTYSLKMVGASSQFPATVGFNIQGFSPWVVLGRYTLTPGEGEGFMGQGFAPGEVVFVYVNTTQGNPALRVTADTSGRVVVQDTWVPASVSGHNVLTLVGQQSKASTSAEFTVMPPAESTPTTPSP